jgi:predicted kinase
MHTLRFMETPTLFVFAGLPGSGKTKLSQYLAGRVGAVHLRIDTIEQAMRDLCRISVEGEGYRLAYRIATDNLRLGLSVVADSCNPIALTRREWEKVARTEGAEWINIEVICSDPAEHRRRVETREPEIPKLELPTWEEVIRRVYHPWDESRITIDTAGRSVEASCAELWSLLGAIPRS